MRESATRCDLCCQAEPGTAEKLLICSGFFKPSSGLEPETPSLPFSDEAGSTGKRGTLRARKPRNKKESPGDE